MIEIPDSDHSILGPSSAERWINCPGSVLATKDLPDQPTHYAIEGTAAHTLSEWVRKYGRPATYFLGKTLRVTRGDTYHDVKVDEEMVDSVQEFCEKVAEYPGHELIETRVSYEKYVPGGFGTLDSGKLTDGLGRVTDFKHGKGVQKYAKKNPQLMLYAIGVHMDYWWLYDLPKFVLAISQPRLDHYAEWEVDTAVLHEWADEVVYPAAKLALTPGAPFKAGEWCQFCKIKATCRTRMQSAFEAVTGEFHDLDAAVALSTDVAATVPLLTNEEIAKALSAWPSIEKWGAALKAYAMHQVLEGRPVGDFKIVAGRSNRGWGAADSVVEEALLAAGAERESLFTLPELVSVAKAEKLVGKKKFEALKELVSKGQGKPALVPGSDPRPPLADASVDDFSEVTEED